MAVKFGERIKQLRTERGLTLDQLAQATDSSKSYIWELENKNPPRPSAEKLSSIAAALGVTVDFLMGADDQTLADAEDKAFYRAYSNLPEDTRRQIRQCFQNLASQLVPLALTHGMPHESAGEFQAQIEAAIEAILAKLSHPADADDPPPPPSPGPSTSAFAPAAAQAPGDGAAAVPGGAGPAAAVDAGRVGRKLPRPGARRNQ